MDEQAEALIRATIHDLANVLSGAQGILDLSDPGRPLSSVERIRLESVLSDGMTTLGRSRHLAMGTFPDASREPGTDWRAALQQQLSPLASLFRCSFDLRHEGDPALDRWPGDLGRDLVHAVTRVILPYLSGNRAALTFTCDASSWQIQWASITGFAESLDPAKTARPRDVSARWVLQVIGSFGAELSFQESRLTCRIPRF